MKVSLAIAALGALLSSALPATEGPILSRDLAVSATNVTADPNTIQAPDDKSVSGSDIGPPVCGTCKHGKKKCCGHLIATGGFGCFTQSCAAEQQQKPAAKPMGLLKGFPPNNSTLAGNLTEPAPTNTTSGPADSD